MKSTELIFGLMEISDVINRRPKIYFISINSFCGTDYKSSLNNLRNT